MIYVIVSRLLCAPRPLNINREIPIQYTSAMVPTMISVINPIVAMLVKYCLTLFFFFLFPFSFGYQVLSVLLEVKVVPGPCYLKQLPES